MYIVVGSITTAARLKKQIEKSTGYPADLVHTPADINKTGGCSYSVRTDDRLASLIRPLCSEYNIRIDNVYAEKTSGGERVFHVIS